MRTARTPRTLRLPASSRPVPTSSRLRTRRLPLPAYAVILLVLPVAVILGARASGWWVTTGHTVPSTATGVDALGGAADQGGAEAGAGGTVALNPHDIKGSMTVQQILDAFPQVTRADILSRFGASPSTPASTQLKALARDGNGFEVDDLREWLETQQGG